MYCSFPYVKGLSEKLKEDLKDVKNVKFGYRPISKLKQYFTNIKSKYYMPKLGACYSIPCEGDSNNSYFFILVNQKEIQSLIGNQNTLEIILMLSQESIYMKIDMLVFHML